MKTASKTVKNAPASGKKVPRNALRYCRRITARRVVGSPTRRGCTLAFDDGS